MEDHMLEEYFTSIKQDFNHLEERFGRLEDKVEQGFKRLESVGFAILEVVKSHDVKFTDLKRRIVNLVNLERQSA